MSEVANVSLVQDLKVFGGRVFELTAGLGDEGSSRELVERLRRAVAEAPRRLARRAAAGDERAKVRELHGAFRALAEAVDALDRLPRSVEASALAQEGAGLCEEVYDLIP